MRIASSIALALVAASAGAQRPVTPTPPAPAPVVVPAPVVAPITPPALTFDRGLGQWRVDRDELERIREEAREASRIDMQQAREDARAAAEQAREAARIDAGQVRAEARAMAPMAFGFGQGIGQGIVKGMAPVAPIIKTEVTTSIGKGFSYSYNEDKRPPSGWAQGDPADSLYRSAYEALNKGDYRKAASLFKDLPNKFPYSTYAADAMYWSAHALYRVGSTPDLQDALQTLDQLKKKYPSARLRSSQSDVAALQTRIAGVLSARGQGGSDIVKSALNSQAGPVCDTEDQQVRSAALSALMQTDPAAATDYAMKMLARKDECSRELRRSAIFLIGERRDPKTVSTLIALAKSDPAPDVRSVAVSYLGRMQSDEAFTALEDLLKTSDDQNVQREVIRSLARSGNPRARAGVKALVERNDAAESLRITALDALDQERATADDVTWLQGLYSKVESPRLRSRIINAMGRLGGSQNEKWFTTLANNENESIDVRLEAVRRAGQSMDIAALGRLYDQTGQRSLRSEIIRQLGNRKESESIDKLGEIAKSGTDPQLRSNAIQALTNKKDERAVKVLLSLIDKPEKE